MEDASGLNIADGDDIIEIGDNNMGVKVYGQGGNDKIIGGFGATQVDKLYGGSGDDKIWMVSPEKRALEDTAAKNYGYGGIGNDTIYGTDADDLLLGDEYNKTDMDINEMD